MSKKKIFVALGIVLASLLGVVAYLDYKSERDFDKVFDIN